MSSIRTRLTIRFAALMLTLMAVFAAAVYFARRKGVEREARGPRHHAWRPGGAILRATQRAGSEQIIVSDSLVGSVLNQEVARLLMEIPGYLIVFDDETGRRLYTSRAVIDLNFLPPSLAQREMAQRDIDAFENSLTQVEKSQRAVRVALRNGDVVLVERRNSDPIFGRRRVIAGVNVRQFDDSPREVLGSALLMLPLILLVAVGGGYVIAGRAVRPIDRITTEVEDITDGRSLHRRLAVESTGDEMTRLTTTLNAMIGRLETSFGALRRFTADAFARTQDAARGDARRRGARHAAPSHSPDQLVALEEALQQTTRMADLVDSLLTWPVPTRGASICTARSSLEPLVREVDGDRVDPRGRRRARRDDAGDR